MVDYNAIQKFITEKNLYFFPFHTVKPVKIVIRHLPGNTSAEDISVALHEIVCDFTSVRHDRQTSHCRRRDRIHPSPSFWLP
jgi:hypothetical protein